MDFYENFLDQCAKKGVSASAAAQAIGLSNAAASGWKTGKVPNDINLRKLAAYFGCPVEALTKEKSPSSDEDAELIEELQMLKDDDDARAVLKRIKNMRPDQVRLLRQWLETMN